MEPQAHKYLSEIENYIPGKSKVGDKKVIKLSSNENALGASPKALISYIEHAKDVFRYADGSATLLREKIAQKNNINFFGYKNHIKVDSESKIITKYGVTSANVHDSQMLDNLIDEKDKDENLYADSAYTGQEQERIIQAKEMKNKVSEKGYKNKPLTEEQKANNKEKSKTRARVEHIFGFMEMSMNSMELNYIGLKRVSAAIGLTNLVYNMFRKIQLQAI